ncbi:MAG: hypothetical protein SFV22_03845 [Saprospiraceae bacterium]|nr:hypothetical protein [Saprospiraceae bacterium]
MIKNFLIGVLVIFLLGNLCRLGLPWWILAPLAAIAGWIIPKSGYGAFLSGFTGGFLCWLIAAWLPDQSNSSLLSTKVGQLFLGASPVTLLLVTALMGGLIGAMGALTGHLAKDALTKPAGRRKYMQERRRR